VFEAYHVAKEHVCQTSSVTDAVMGEVPLKAKHRPNRTSLSGPTTGHFYFASTSPSQNSCRGLAVSMAKKEVKRCPAVVQASQPKKRLLRTPVVAPDQKKAFT
jgi:hypothetical protein